jgi:sortase A
VARLVAPRLSKSNIVLAEAGGEALAFGPALLEAGAKPGQSGQTIIAAHRNTHFSWVRDLKSGDSLWLQTAEGEELEYAVTGMQVVRYDASGIDPAARSDALVLVTCYPFLAPPGGPLRYVVWAKPLAKPLEAANAAIFAPANEVIL